MKPICVPCRRFFRPKENGLVFVEGMPVGGASGKDIIGTRSPGSWTPYKAWNGDMWACPDCGAEIVVGVAQRAFAEHYEPDFAETVQRHGGSRLQVNDC